MAVSLCCKCLTVAWLFLLHIQMCTSDKLPEPYVTNKTAKAVTLNCTPPAETVKSDRWDAVYSLQITTHLPKVFGSSNETVAKVFNNKSPERGGQFFKAAVGKVDGWLGMSTLRDSDPLPYLQVTFLVTQVLQGDYFCEIQYHSSPDAPESSPVFSSKVTVGEDGGVTPSMGTEFKSAIVQGVQVTATWHHQVTPFIEAGVFATPVDRQGQQIGTRHTLFLAHEAPSEGQDVGAGGRVYTHPQVLVLSFKIDPNHDTNGQNLTVILFLKKQSSGQRFSTAAMYDYCFGSDEQVCLSDPKQNHSDSCPVMSSVDYKTAFIITTVVLPIVGLVVTVIVICINKRKTKTRKQRQNRKNSNDSDLDASTPLTRLPSQQTPVQISPSQQTPVQISPSQQTPVQINPSQQTPVQISPSQQTPVQINPSQQTPVQINPSQQTPVQINPPQQTQGQTNASQPTPVQINLSQQTQGQTNASQQAQSQNNPSHQTQGQTNPPQHTQGQNNPSHQTPGQNNPPQLTQGQNNPSQQTQGQNNPSQQTQGQNNPSGYSLGRDIHSQVRSNGFQQTPGQNDPLQQTQAQSGSLEQQATLQDNPPQEAKDEINLEYIMQGAGTRGRMSGITPDYGNGDEGGAQEAVLAADITVSQRGYSVNVNTDADTGTNAEAQSEFDQDADPGAGLPWNKDEGGGSMVD